MEDKFRELIEAKGQTDGLYLVIYPHKSCRVRLRRDNKIYDVNMALLNDRNKVEFLISKTEDDLHIEFIPLNVIAIPTLEYFFDCFKEE